MKTLTLTMLFMVTCLFATAADTLSSNIKEATVFLSGAQVFRETKNFSIKKGVNEIIIKDVSPNLNPKNIQASAEGNFLILDVQRKIEHVIPPANKAKVVPEKVQREMDVLNDSILFIGFEREEVEAKLATLREEKNLIMQNKLIKGGGSTDTLPELRDVVKFYRSRLNEINALIHRYKKHQHFVGVRYDKFNGRLNELKNFNRAVGQPVRSKRQRHHIVVTTYAEAPAYGKIKTNYLVTNAGWIPSYDLRADDVSKPMEVTYKAHVYQNSGEEWDNINLTLSTYNQNCFTSKPTIGIWRLDYQIITYNQGQPKVIQHSQNFSSQIQMQAFQNGYAPVEPRSIANSGYIVDTAVVFNAINEEFNTLDKYAELDQSFSNVEFKVKLPYSVKSDGSHKLMVVTQETVPAVFDHYLLPRANKNGFLMAKIGDWESLNLLPGKANIYFEKTYVGETQMDPAILKDSIELALGRDRGILSTRKKVDDETKKTALGKRKLRTMSFEIVVRNNTKNEILLNLEDQIPITSNEEIEIKLVEDGGCELEESTGMLKWKLKLRPGEKQVINFSYSVEHDKDKEVA